MLPEWAPFIEQAIHAGEHTLDGTEQRNRLSQCYQRLRSESKHPPLSHTRLRHTWLAILMASPEVSLATLLNVAGLRSARTLEDLVPFVPQNKTYDLLVGRAAQTRKKA